MLLKRLLPLFCIAALAGCGRNDVKVYRVAKPGPQGTAPQPQASMMPSGQSPASGTRPSLQWKLPKGWEEVPPSPMRAASFKVKGQDGKVADVGVFPFPGMAGTDLENVNRWREQVNLAPIDAAELPKEGQPVEIASQQAEVYDIAGTVTNGVKTRILATIMQRDGIDWFFKMMGDDALVAAQKPAFLGFLQSLKFGAASPSGLPPGHPDISAAGMNMFANAPANSNQPKPKWDVPSDWHAVASGPFLVAKYQLGPAGAPEGEVNVAMSAGNGGGLVPNVNRWRSQLGLGTASADEVNKLASNIDVGASAKAVQVEMTGTDPKTGQKAHIVAVIVSREGETWFYKLMGNEQLVEKEKPAFTKFVKTATYPNGL
jgi:hypothetical protein